MKTSLLLMDVVLITSVLTVSARKKFARANGRVLCRINGRLYPVKYAKVSLLDKDPIGHDTFGSSVNLQLSADIYYRPKMYRISAN